MMTSTESNNNHNNIEDIVGRLQREQMDDPTMSVQVQKMLGVLELRSGFPQKLREGMDEALEGVAGHFLFSLERKLVDLLYGNVYNPMVDRMGDAGLDSEVDSLEEVETAIRCFPSVISRLSHAGCTMSNSGYPIGAQVTLRSAKFIPLLTKLGMEFGNFTPSECGGLKSEQFGSRHPLARYSGSNTCMSSVLFDLATTTVQETTEKDNPEHHQRLDETFLEVIRELRAKELFLEEDVCKPRNMVAALCSDPSYFSSQRFDYLVEWNPWALTVPDRDGNLPIQIVAFSSDIDRFRRVLSRGLHHFPTQLGGLFHSTSGGGKSAFRRACHNFGTATVTAVVRDLLAATNKNAASLDTLVSLASQEPVDLDGLFFWLRRDPTMTKSSSYEQQQQLLQHLPSKRKLGSVNLDNTTTTTTAMNIG